MIGFDLVFDVVVERVMWEQDCLYNRSPQIDRQRIMCYLERRSDLGSEIDD